MKLYYLFLAFTISITGPILAQPNFALANKLTRPVYYSMGRIYGKPEERAINKPLEILTANGSVAKTIPYIGNMILKPSQWTELLISSRPGQAALFTFVPEKTIYVTITEDKNRNLVLVPQTGTVSSLWRKTERGYPLENNISKENFNAQILTSQDIPASNPDTFLKIFIGAEPHVILGIARHEMDDSTIVDARYKALAQKWNPLTNKTPGAREAFGIILDAFMNLNNP